MTTIDWRALRPHVPLSPGDTQYVERSGSVGDEIAQWILADRSPLLVGGPAGVGKSTELARAAKLLQPHRVACLVQLDRFESMRRLTPDRMRMRIAEMLGYLALQALHLQLSPGLASALERANAQLRGENVTHELTPTALLDVAVAEIQRLSKRARVTLLIDGLEKVPQGSESLDLFEALASIRDEVELVVVIPWHATFGPQAETVVRAGERFVAVRALDVAGPTGDPGRAFLRRVLAQRLHWNEEEEFDPNAVVGAAGPSLDAARARVAARRNLVNDAILWSGGLPRVFLQLLADAGSYAKLRRSDPWPIVEDLNDACADQVDSFRRLLLPGDVDGIRGAAGTNGSELDLERKVRLMAHGILLERLRDGARVLDVHPLAQAAFDAGGTHA
jgi:hypothetical protein